VRVHNDHGTFEVRVRFAAAVAPGEAILYHAWEPSPFPRLARQHGSGRLAVQAGALGR